MTVVTNFVCRADGKSITCSSCVVCTGMAIRAALCHTWFVLLAQGSNWKRHQYRFPSGGGLLAEVWRLPRNDSSLGIPHLIRHPSINHLAGCSFVSFAAGHNSRTCSRSSCFDSLHQAAVLSWAIESHCSTLGNQSNPITPHCMCIHCEAAIAFTVAIIGIFL